MSLSAETTIRPRMKLRIPIRGYETVFRLVTEPTNELRIPIRGYETSAGYRAAPRRQRYESL